MRRVYSVDVFLGTVTRHSEISDNLARIYYLSIVNIIVRVSLSQMRVIIVSQIVVGTDADAPAAVLIPTERFDSARFHCNDRCPECTDQIVAEVTTCKAIAAPIAEIGVVAVAVARRDRRERLQSVSRDPLHLTGRFVRDLDRITAD